MINLTDINRAYREYYRTTGREPTRVYLGHEEYYDMCRIGETFSYGSINADGDFTSKIMGLTVFNVNVNNHLFVC